MRERERGREREREGGRERGCKRKKQKEEKKRKKRKKRKKSGRVPRRTWPHPHSTPTPSIPGTAIRSLSTACCVASYHSSVPHIA
eukprot:1351473-Rhodomonas_salina.1